MSDTSDQDNLSKLGGAWDRRWLENVGPANRDAMAREMLSVFADRLPGCVYIKELDSRLIFVNRYMRNVLGADRWLGQTPADYLPKGLAEAVMEHDRLALTDGQVLRQEFLPDVDGNLRAWRTCRFEIARPGLPSLIGCISLDISESHRAQQALRESEARYRAILEDQTEMICRFRSDGVIEYVNEAYCRYFGRSRESLVGNVYRPVVHPDDLDRVEQEVRQITPENPVKLIENRVVLQGGKTRWTQWINRGFFDRHGRLLGYQSVGQDIHDRKQAQEGLLEYQRQLRSLASQLALAEERQRRIIAAGLHDRIGQSLAAMKLDLGMLRRSLDDATHKQRLGEVIDDLDAVMRDTWTLTFELCPPMLYEVGLEAALEWLIQRLRQEHELEIVLEETGNGAQLPDDQRGLMFQVVRELLSNVVKHARARRAVVRIDQRPGTVSLMVRDDGAGFDPGEAIHPTSDAGGFGLLGIRERLRPFGGSVDIQSQPGQGTVVRVDLPTAKETDTDERDEASDSAGR